MKVGQPAVARLEKGSDAKIETLDSYIRALGGHLEIRAVFRDSCLSIFGPHLETRKRASSKSGRPARA